MTKSDQALRPADLLPDVTAAVREAGELIRAEANRLGGRHGCDGKAPVDDEAEHLLKTQRTSGRSRGRPSIVRRAAIELRTLRYQPSQ